MEQEKESQKTELQQVGSQFVTLEQIAKIAQNLNDAEVIDVDLASDYWSPKTLLECKKLLFLVIQDREVNDINDPSKRVMLPTAFFIENVVGEGGKTTVKRVCNSSRKLLGLLADNNVQPNTPLLVTYLGKVKNKTNQFDSETWSVKHLKLA
ncbi:hypothetical protein AD998_01925 [bacterium 336/3]|nr:hypothetical protein AD998_01925 [bacterium 336/3]